MSVFGSRLFGKVDVVPGLFHVATKCGHINYVPLIPMKSYIIISQSGNTFRGVPIPLSMKSWGMAWGRFIGWVAALIGAILAIVGLTAHQPARKEEWLPGLGLLVAGLLLVMALYRFKPITHAGYDRAARLATIAGLNEEGMARLRSIYGISPTVAPSTAKSTIPPRVPLPSQRK